MVAFLDPTLTPFAATFFFVFALVFGLLSYMKTGEEKEKKTTFNFSSRVNAVIALAIALFSVSYEPLVVGLQQFMPLVTMLLIAIFFILFVKKLFSGGKEKQDTLPIVASLAILLLVLGVLGDKILALLPVGLDLSTFLWIVGLIIVILIFAAVWNSKGGTVIPA